MSKHRICGMDRNTAQQAAQVFQANYYEQKERADGLAKEVEQLKAIVDPIEELRIDDYIIIHSGTESGYKPEYESVEVAAEWTNGETEWFHGPTLADALKAAGEAKAERKASG